ncbi:hypothetical protein FRACA_840008 [Frankia canadensis]|uniref:Uncharacterized protein n=1 Tax=Frankia canadensis TaxID=1836972 RepID=A0A2I2L1S8_9ACTN|nr:hypothetical protein FRACA_840008 [Frankia canadensis]SOU59160.1 hypothetical protein FRACA_840008 [Frankia canadensis]
MTGEDQPPSAVLPELTTGAFVRGLARLPAGSAYPAIARRVSKIVGNPGDVSVGVMLTHRGIRRAKCIGVSPHDQPASVPSATACRCLSRDGRTAGGTVPLRPSGWFPRR